MEIDTFRNAEMTSSNLKKIMRTNLNLNSKILAKNTTEIVNNCIGKLYKQIPLTFKNGLQQGKIGNGVKTENYGPIQRLKMQDCKRQQTTAIKPLKAQLLSNLMSMSRKPAPLTPRKTPCYKIYKTRRYCSSASSSSGSILQRKEDKLHSTRAYHTPATNKQPITCMQHKPVSLKLSIRNQHMSSNVDSIHERAMQVSGQIQRDLMAIDELVKNRLKLRGKSQDAQAAIASNATKDGVSLPATGKNFKKLQILKEVELLHKLHTSKLTKGISSSLERRRTPLAAKQTVKHIKVQIPLKETALENQNIEDFQTFPRGDKENKLNQHLKKHFRTSFQKQATITDGSVLGKSSPQQTSEDKLRKPYKLNRNIAPSATYCLLKPQPLSSMRHIN